MNRMNDFLDALEGLGFRLADFVAGMAGGIVHMLIDNSEKSILHRALNVLAGAVTAAYITPLVAYYMSIDEAFERALAFLIGSIGLRLMDKVLEFIEKNDIPTIIRLLIFKKRK